MHSVPAISVFARISGQTIVPSLTMGRNPINNILWPQSKPLPFHVKTRFLSFRPNLLKNVVWWIFLPLTTVPNGETYVMLISKYSTERNRTILLERLLLNLLISLMPVFVYQILMLSGMFHRESRAVHIYIGIVSGIASLLCMVFPIVTGAHFLWDLRWVPFLISVIYGSWPGGLIAAVFMLAYRAYLGGGRFVVYRGGRRRRVRVRYDAI